MNRGTRAAALAAAALGIGFATRAGSGKALDERAFRLVNGAGSPSTDAAMKAVTELGSIWAAIGGCAILGAAGYGRTARRAGMAAGVAWTMGQLLKRAFMRPRPYDAFPGEGRLLIGRPKGTSWPSSHPMVLLAFLTVAARELDLPGPWRTAALALAGTVGLSRTALGVHFPADVAGGLLLGRAVGVAWPAFAQTGR